MHKPTHARPHDSVYAVLQYRQVCVWYIIITRIPPVNVILLLLYRLTQVFTLSPGSVYCVNPIKIFSTDNYSAMQQRIMNTQRIGTEGQGYSGFIVVVTGYTI